VDRVSIESMYRMTCNFLIASFFLFLCGEVFKIFAVKKGVLPPPFILTNAI
jgi:Sec-independent protein secretion pathway component TatC